MNLSTNYMGFKLPHPLIAGASPLSDHLDGVRRLEEAGASAIVLRSLFEEQLTIEGLAHHRAMDTHANSSPEARSYFVDRDEFAFGPDEYLVHLAAVKSAVKVPVIASLNGVTPGGWLYYAHLMQQAGADAIELNFFYIATDPTETGQQVEDRVVHIVQTVARELRIPVAVKLAPFFTSFANLAQRLAHAGATGLVLFNRFYEPDIDTEVLNWTSQLSLSNSSDLLLRLRWLALLAGRVNADLAVTGGIHQTDDVVKAVMCGAQAVQLVSALLRGGPQVIPRLRNDLRSWLEERQYESLGQMCGSMSAGRCPDPQALARGNYLQMLQTWRVSVD